MRNSLFPLAVCIALSLLALLLIIGNKPDCPPSSAAVWLQFEVRWVCVEVVER